MKDTNDAHAARTLERVRQMVKASLARAAQKRCLAPQSPTESQPVSSIETLRQSTPVDTHIPEPLLLPGPVSDRSGSELEPPAEAHRALLTPVDEQPAGPVFLPEPVFDCPESELEPPVGVDLAQFALVGQRIPGPVLLPEPTFDDLPELSPEEMAAQLSESVWPDPHETVHGS